jgi:hypothetical protein
MTQSETNHRSVRIVRWIARLWSLVILAFVVMMVVTPDPYATEPVPLEDWFLMGLWGLVLLWLLVAWRWELLGGILAIATMFVRELAWVLIKGNWFPGFFILWATFLPPAVLFLIAWGLARKGVIRNA